MTSDKTTEFMESLRAQVEAADAAQDAKLASIMAHKPLPRPRKVEQPQDWLASDAPPAKKSSKMLANKSGKPTGKRPPKTQQP